MRRDYWPGISNRAFVYVDSGNSRYLSDGGVLYEKQADGSLILLQYPTDKEDAVYEVLDGTTRIEILRSYFVEKVVFPSSMRIVGPRAFYLSPWLEEIEMNDGLEIINTSAFWGCKSLKRLDIPQTVTDMYYWDTQFEDYGWSKDMPRLTMDVYFYGSAPDLDSYISYPNYVDGENHVTSVTYHYPQNASGWNEVIEGFEDEEFAELSSFSPWTPPASTDAPDPSVISFDFYDETIMYDDTLYDVNTKEDFTGTSLADGDKVTPGSFLFVRYRGGDAVAVKVVNPRPSTILFAFDYEDEYYTTGTNDEYSFDGRNWRDCVPKMPYSLTEGHEKVYFRYKASDKAFSGNIIEMYVPKRPAAPRGLEAEAISREGAEDGRITGVDSSMEYRRKGGEWMSCTGNVIGDLPGGLYEVRYKAGPDTLAGEAKSVAITTGYPLPSLVDVPAGSWYREYVEYVYVNGLMDGTGATTFEPDADMTRAMVWAILARMDGETVTGASWQAEAREWAMANGVSDGTDPNGLVTREQFATMLWRYAGEPASSCSLSAFTDAASVSGWAGTAMAWAVEKGIVTGVTATTLVPQGTATRAQAAAMLMRFAQL